MQYEETEALRGKWFGQSHSANKQHSQEPNPINLEPESRFLINIL